MIEQKLWVSAVGLGDRVRVDQLGPVSRWEGVDSGLLVGGKPP